MLHPDPCDENTSWDSQATTLPFSKCIKSSIRQTNMGRTERRFFWNGGDAEGPKSILRYLQAFRDRMWTTLKSTAFFAYPVLVVLMNCSAKYRHLLLENSHTGVCFRPFRVGSNLKNVCGIHEGRRCIGLRAKWCSSVEARRFSSQIRARKKKKNLLHEDMMGILRPQADAQSASFEDDGVGQDVLSCFLILSSYCCNLHRGTDISCVKHDIAVTTPCLRCTVNLQDIRDLLERDKQRWKQTMLLREKYA